MRLPSALSGWVLASLFGVHALTLNFYPVQWFGDDLHYIRFAAQHRDASIAQILRYQDRSLERYRPLSKLLVLQAYRWAALNPALPRLATTVSVGLTLLLMLALGRSLGIERSAVHLGAIFFLIHQLPISALYRNARMEQHFTLFGLAAVVALDRGLRGSDRARTAALFVVPLLLGTALLWSEAALCFPLVVTIWAIHRDDSPRPLRVRTAIAVIAGAGLVACAYLGWYRAIGAPVQGADRYAFGVGANVVANIATAVAGWTSPVSSVAILGWLQDPRRHAAGLSLAAAASLLVLVSLVAGWRRARHALLFLASAGSCLLPVVLLRHVSEFYVYPSLLFFCLAAGILLYERLQSLPRSLSLGSVAVAILILAGAGGHVCAAAQKVMLFHDNGRRFARLVQELEEKAGALERGNVRLVSEGPERRPISQFILPMRLVYLTGPQRGYDVEWFPSVASQSGDWIVREDGSLVATGGP